MKISRIQVEEGFMDGLDLRFSSGLNTIIGARGTGKTSIVELMRYAVGSPEEFSHDIEKADAHARAILGSGQVTVTIEESNGELITSSRAANEEMPRANGIFAKPIIFSQTEIENLGKASSGRLGLIDRFVHGKSAAIEEESHIMSRVASLTSEISYKSTSLKKLENEWSMLPHFKADLKEVEKREASIKESSGLMKSEYGKLKTINTKISQSSVLENHLKRFLEISGTRVSSLQELDTSWRNLIDPKLFHHELAQGKVLVKAAMDSVALAQAKLKEADDFFRAKLKETETKRVSLETIARSLRVRLESVEKGFGQISRTAQRLREQIAQLESLSSLVEQEKLAIAKIQISRNELLDELSKLRLNRYNQRVIVAEVLNEKLSPAIKVSIENAGQTEQYEQVLINQFKGSGLRYAELVKLLANLVEPRELVEWTETNNFEALAEALGVSVDRAVRLVAALEKSDLGKIITYPLEDTASFYLLDGVDVKPISELSLGQRCTVVLPIVLQLSEAIIVLDQPEDHIDNAFIADTLIRAIRERAFASQLIVTTHNANIPVLGEASQVTLLASDGNRGYVSFSKELDSNEAIEAISSLMEGGKDAFARRAAFYMVGN